MLRALFECEDHGQDDLFINTVGVYENEELAEKAAAECLQSHFGGKFSFDQMEKAEYGTRFVFKIHLGEDYSYGFHIKDYELNQKLMFTEEFDIEFDEMDFSFDDDEESTFVLSGGN